METLLEAQFSIIDRKLLMNKKESMLEFLRISVALIISSFVLFLMNEADLIPIEDKYSFLLEWLGLIAVACLFISYLIAILVLEREQIREVNYRDLKIYIYGVVFIVSIYLILIVYFG